MTESEMLKDRTRPEYDFSKGVRGKHHRAYRAGYTVRVARANGSVEERHFTLKDGAVMFAPDIKERSRDSEAVNRAFRTLIKQG